MVLYEYSHKDMANVAEYLNVKNLSALLVLLNLFIVLSLPDLKL